MISKALDKWASFCNGVSASILITANRVLQRRVDYLSRQRDELTDIAASRENKAKALETVNTQLISEVKRLQGVVDQLQQQSPVEQQLQFEIDRLSKVIGTLQTDLRAEEQRVKELSAELSSKKTKSSSSDEALARRVRSHINACRSRTIEIACGSDPGQTVEIGKVLVPTSELLTWHADQLGEVVKDKKAQP